MSLQQTPFSIINNKENMRFEIREEDSVAYLEYRMYKKDIAFMHTFVPENLGGRGLASSLAIHAFNYAKEHKLPVMVFCPFVAGFIKKYPEYREQLDPQYYHKYLQYPDKEIISGKSVTHPSFPDICLHWLNKTCFRLFSSS